MASKYWIKLYIEILDDPKMGRLSDRLYRRTIELFLLAGDVDGDGLLPSVNDISWRLRLDAEQLETDMIELQKIGILSVDDGNWIVTKFSERQAPVSDAERMRRLRERKQKQQYYDTVTSQSSYATVTNRNVDTDTDTESDTEAEDSATAAAVFSHFESNIGILSPAISDKIQAALDDYPADWIIDAMYEAVKYEKRNWAYVSAILKRWKQEGRTQKKENGAIDYDSMASEVYQ